MADMTDMTDEMYSDNYGMSKVHYIKIYFVYIYICLFLSYIFVGMCIENRIIIKFIEKIIYKPTQCFRTMFSKTNKYIYIYIEQSS